MEKSYSFRKLNSTDIFPMVSIINKIGVAELKGLLDKNSMNALVKSFMTPENEENKDKKEKKDSSEIIMQVGISIAFDIATIILKNLPKCETEIFDMLANVSDLTVKQIKNLDMNVFFEMIIDFLKKDEFKDFLKVVSKFLK